MRIVVDFDGTIVEHAFPEIGKPVPGALETLRWLKDAGCWLGLFTMRSGDHLAAAVEWLEAQGFVFTAVNVDVNQKWTTSPKMYGTHYIDDAAVGCPLLPNEPGTRPMVDWSRVRALLEPFVEEFVKRGGAVGTQKA